LKYKDLLFILKRFKYFAHITIMSGSEDNWEGVRKSESKDKKGELADIEVECRDCKDTFIFSVRD